MENKVLINDNDVFNSMDSTIGAFLVKFILLCQDTKTINLFVRKIKDYIRKYQINY
jgi:hypothetical protein